MNPAVGVSRIGKYSVTEEIGSGGFGRVVKGWDSSINRPVAIKLIKAEQDPDLLSRFRAEAATTANLRHPNIVIIHEFGEQAGDPYIVMEFLKGRDLNQVLRSATVLPLSLKVRILSQTAQGLHYAHQCGVVHRDIKPANIMLLEEGTAKIMDFGISRMVGEQNTRITRTGLQVGTFRYMAPEQLSGEDADVQTDIFSFGVLTYEFLSGRYPFAGESQPVLMYNIGGTRQAPLDTVLANCPKALAEIVDRALEKKRHLRYNSLEDLDIDLKPVLMTLERDEAEELTKSVPQLLATGKIPAAEAILRRSLQLDPANTRAKELREELRRRKESLVVGVRVGQLVARAEQLRAQREFPEAIRCLEDAMACTPADAGIRHRLESLQREAGAVEAAQRLMTLARSYIEKRDFSEAFQKAALAVDQDPENKGAAALLGWIREQKEKQNKEAAIHSQISVARGHAGMGDFDRALDTLQQLLVQHPDASAARELLVSIQAEKRAAALRHMFVVGLQRVDSFVLSREFDKARHALNLMREKFPDEEVIRRKLEMIEEQATLEREEAECTVAIEGASALAAQGDYRGAVRLLERQRSHPRVAEALDRIAAEIERSSGASVAVSQPAADALPPLPPPNPTIPQRATRLNVRLVAAATGVLAATIGIVWFPAAREKGSHNPVPWMRLLVDPPAISFRWRLGDALPPDRNLRVSANGGTIPDSLRVEPGAPWIKVKHEARESQGNLRVSVDPRQLTTGSHASVITLAFPAESLKVPVTVDVEPARPAATEPPPGGRVPPPVVRNPLPVKPPKNEPPKGGAGGSTQTTKGTELDSLVPTRTPKPDDPAEPAPGRYFGNPVGFISWGGELAPGASVTLGRDRVVSGGGKLSDGFLPGVAVEFRRVVPPAERLAVVEMVSAANQFGRVTLRNIGSDPITFIRIDWRVLE